MNNVKFGAVITQWAGGRGQGLSEIGAKIEAAKHRRQFPQATVTVEDAGWLLNNGKQAKKVVVWQPRDQTP